VKSQAVFQEAKELDRLAVQNRLLLTYEEPIFSHIFSQRSGLRVLDIGCNDGSKTVQRFSSESVAAVMGLEYNPELADRAQRTYGGGKFSFHACDVESGDFSRQLGEWMGEAGIRGFDVVYLSFLLMHLRQPERFLTALRPFLAPGGQLVVVEANDAASFLKPYENRLLREFLDILEKDVYSGNRKLGHLLPQTLEKCGYRKVTLWHNAIGASGPETEKKADIFTMFFSFLAEDVEILRALYPEEPEYRQWAHWLEQNFDKLKAAIMGPDSSISMGMRILTCEGSLPE